MDIIYSLLFTDNAQKWSQQVGPPWMLVSWMTYLRLDLKHDPDPLIPPSLLFALLSAASLDRTKSHL